MARILPATSNFISNQGLLEELDNSVNYKICFLKSPAGYGKTTLLGKWLENKDFENIYWYSFKKIESLPSVFFKSFFGGLKSKLKNVDLEELYENYRLSSLTNEEIINLALLLNPDLEMTFVLDDFQNLSSDVYKLLKVFIENTSYKYHFVIASREIIPMEFSDFVIHNQIYFIDQGFSFGVNETKEFFKSKGIEFTNEKIEEIIKYTNGWVPAYVSLAMSYKTHNEMDDGYLDYLYAYLKDSVFVDYSTNAKNALKLAYCLEAFSKKSIAKILKLNNEETKKIFESLEHFFVRVDEVNYTLIPFLRDFISTELSDKAYKNYCKMIANYFYSLKKYNVSIRFYIKSNSFDNLENALQKYAIESNYNFDEISDALYLIGNEVAFKSPIILFALIIDSFNNFQTDKVAFYYDKLSILANLATDDIYEKSKKALNYLIFYNFKIKNSYFFNLLNKEYSKKIETIDLCSYFPSVLRGLRDFSDSIDNIDGNYLLRTKLKDILGDKGNYLYDIVTTEIELERGNVKNAIMKANSLLYYNSNITSEIRCILTNILIRGFIVQHKISNISKALVELKNNIIEANKLYLLPNFRALAAKYYYMTDNSSILIDWLNEHANKKVEQITFRQMYIYKTKAKLLAIKGEYDDAIRLVESLIYKCLLYGRKLDLAELYFIKAIIYNNNINEMVENIKKSLDITMPLNFILMYYEYGVAGISVLEASLQMLSDEYFKYVKNILRNKVDYSIEDSIKDDLELKKLSKQETLILKLLEKGYSNDRICEEIDIKLSTVKTYITRIFTKLGVKNRNQAVKIAKELDII